MDEIIISNSIFDSIKHIDENGVEYWSARELMPILGYNKWQNFHKVIKQAMVSCNNSKNNTNEHFPEMRKVLTVGNGAKQKVKDYRLSRYACYLIAQNADSRKEVVALAQTYFAIQTYRQEVADHFNIRLYGQYRIDREPVSHHADGGKVAQGQCFECKRGNVRPLQCGQRSSQGD